MPPVPPGERYEDLIEVFTVLSRTLAEDESVHDTLQSILALALRLVPGCTAASVTVLDEQGQPSTIAATDEDTRNWTAGSTSCRTVPAWTRPGGSR